MEREEVAERGAGVTEIGWSAERLFRRSRSAHTLCSRQTVMRSLMTSFDVGKRGTKSSSCMTSSVDVGGMQASLTSVIVDVAEPTL